MMCSTVLMIKVTGKMRRKAGEARANGGSWGGGDYCMIPGLFWRPKERPQRCVLIVYGSDFRALEEVDWERYPILTVSNAYLLQPRPDIDPATGELRGYTHFFKADRGSQVVVTSYGGKRLASHMDAAHSGDGRRVDRPAVPLDDSLPLVQTMDLGLQTAADSEVSHVDDPRPGEDPRAVRFRT